MIKSLMAFSMWNDILDFIFSISSVRCCFIMELIVNYISVFVTFHASNYRICEHQHLRRNLPMQRQRDAPAVGQTCSSCTHAGVIIKSGYRQFDWYVMTDNDIGQLRTLADDDSGWDEHWSQKDIPASMTNLFVVTFCEDPHLSAGLSRTEDSIELDETQHFSSMTIFDDVRDSFQSADFRLTFRSERHAEIRERNV